MSTASTMKKSVTQNDNDENEDRLEFSFFKINSLWRRLYNRHNKTIGNVSERRVVTAIDFHPGLPQSSIALFLDIEPQNLIRIIDSLEEQGFLERRTSDNDRRVKTLHLLAKGKDYAKDCYKIGDKFREDILDGISTQNLRVVDDVLATIEDNLLTIVS